MPKCRLQIWPKFALQIVDQQVQNGVDCRQVYKALEGVECRLEPCFQCRFVDQLFPPCVCRFYFFWSQCVDLIKIQMLETLYGIFKNTSLLIIDLYNSSSKSNIKFYSIIIKKIPVEDFLFIFMFSLYTLFKCRFYQFRVQIVDLSFSMQMQIFLKFRVQIVDRKAKNGVIYIQSDPPINPH